MTSHTNVSYHVLVDTENASRLRAALAPFIHVDEVPKEFQARHAKYKARSLEWFRRKWKLTNQDWVLHLDEETEIDLYALRSCLDFIERGREDIGMVSKWFCAAIKIIRVSGSNIIGDYFL